MHVAVQLVTRSYLYIFLPSQQIYHISICYRLFRKQILLVQFTVQSEARPCQYTSPPSQKLDPVIISVYFTVQVVQFTTCLKLDYVLCQYTLLSSQKLEPLIMPMYFTVYLVNRQILSLQITTRQKLEPVASQYTLLSIQQLDHVSVRYRLLNNQILSVHFVQLQVNLSLWQCVVLSSQKLDPLSVYYCLVISQILLSVHYCLVTIQILLVYITV